MLSKTLFILFTILTFILCKYENSVSPASFAIFHEQSKRRQPLFSNKLLPPIEGKELPHEKDDINDFSIFSPEEERKHKAELAAIFSGMKATENELKSQDRQEKFDFFFI